MKKYYALAIMFIAFGCIVQAQTADSISMMLANPETNQQVLKQAMDNYISSGGAIDSSLLKTFSRHNAYYGAYEGANGGVNSFMPDYLVGGNLPQINGCNLPSKEWETLGPKFIDVATGNNGRLTSVAIDTINDYVYSGSESGGLWKKSIGTDNWLNITDKLGFPALGIQCIAINPEDPQEIYCATAYGGYNGMHGYGIGLIHSTDGGASWNREVINNTQAYNIEALSVAYTDFYPYTVFAGVGNNLYRNNGTSWDSIFSTDPNPYVKELIRDIKFIAPKNSAPRKIFFSTHDVNSWRNANIIYHTLDTNNNLLLNASNQTNWDTVSLIDTNVMGGIQRVALDISRLNPQRIVASYSSGPKVRVIKSDDYGITWDTLFSNDSITDH